MAPLTATNAAVALAACIAGAASAVRSPFIFPNAAGLQAFSAAKFGLFIHWAPVSQWGAELSFPLACTSFPCYPQGPNGTAVTIRNVSELVAHRQAYTALAKTFNPTAFDADALAGLASAAGFQYLTWVGKHCDGFANYNSSAGYSYSIMSTPFAQDTFAAMATAFRARSMRVGVYVCPSFWNRDDYWAPSAMSSFGTCCQPNYTPSVNTSLWSTFTSFLHGEMKDLANKYAPSHYWIDSGTYPPSVDTHIEAVLPALRAANPEVVVQVRDGGVWHDYVESVDHSEDDAHDLLGVSQLRAASLGVPTPPGTSGFSGLEAGVWEVPGTLGQQWGYDPRAVYEDAETVVRKLVGVAAKGGNFLLNIGLDPTGVWAPAAVDVLTNLSLWMAYNSEAVHNTTASFPFEYFNGPLQDDSGLLVTQLFTASTVRDSTYVSLVDDRGAVITPTSTIIIPTFKPSLLSSLPTAVSLLTPTGAKPLSYTLDETGLSIPAAEVLQPAPVVLGTYYFNYTSKEDAEALFNSVGPEWPGHWWEAARDRASAGMARGSSGAVNAAAAASRTRKGGTRIRSAVTSGAATGSNSLTRRTYAQVHGVPVLPDAATSVDNAPCGMRQCSVYTQAGYSYVRPEGTCYRSSFLPGGEPAVQLTLFYNGQDDNMAAPTAPTDGQAWQDVDTECWIYANSGPGRQAVEVWHSAALGDYWTLSSDASRAAAQAAGYVLYATLGSADPAPAGGFLSAQQVQDAVASYAYVVRLDWS